MKWLRNESQVISREPLNTEILICQRSNPFIWVDCMQVNLTNNNKKHLWECYIYSLNNSFEIGCLKREILCSFKALFTFSLPISSSSFVLLLLSRLLFCSPPSELLWDFSIILKFQFSQSLASSNFFVVMDLTFYLFKVLQVRLHFWLFYTFLALWLFWQIFLHFCSLFFSYNLLSSSCACFTFYLFLIVFLCLSLWLLYWC